MKALMTALAGMGVIGIFLMVGIWGGLLALTIYGLYLAFSASIILGVLALIVEPSPLVIGLVMFFFNKNLAQMLMDILTK